MSCEHCFHLLYHYWWGVVEGFADFKILGVIVHNNEVGSTLYFEQVRTDFCQRFVRSLVVLEWFTILPHNLISCLLCQHSCLARRVIVWYVTLFFQIPGCLGVGFCAFPVGCWRYYDLLALEKKPILICDHWVMVIVWSETGIEFEAMFLPSSRDLMS